MSQEEQHLPSVKAYFDGINAERYSDVAELFAVDGELLAPGTEPRRGGQAILAYFQAALRPYPEHFDDPGRILFSGDSVTVEIHFSGRTATGFRVEFEAVDVIDFDAAGKIARLTSWYDSHAVRQQLRQAHQAADGAAGSGTSGN